MNSVPVLKPVRFHTSNHRRGHRFLAVCIALLLLCASLPLASVAAPTANKPFLVYGIKNNGATQLYNPYDSSDNFFIGGIPFLGQTAQQGNNYDAFVGVFSVSNAQTSQSGDDNFGADIVAAKPLYAFLQGKSYTRTVGSAYVQNVANDMTITGNNWSGGGNLTGTTATGTMSSPYDTLKISAGIFRLRNMNVTTTSSSGNYNALYLTDGTVALIDNSSLYVSGSDGGAALHLDGGTITQIRDTSIQSTRTTTTTTDRASALSLTNAAARIESIDGETDITASTGPAIYLSAGIIDSIATTGTVQGGSGGAALSIQNGTVYEISGGTYTAGSNQPALYIAAGGSVGEISNGTFTPGSTSSVGLQNNGSLAIIRGGTFYGYQNNGTISDGIVGGTFDFTTYTASSFADIKWDIAPSAIARLDSTAGNGKFTVVANDGITEGTYIGKAPANTTYTTSTFDGETTYTVTGSTDPGDPDPDPTPDPTTEVSSGYYVLVNRQSGYVLTVPYSAQNSETACLTVNEANGGTAQTFYMEKGVSTYQLTAYNASDRVLSAQSASSNAYSVLKNDTNASTQQWILTKASGNGYVLLSAADQTLALGEVGSAAFSMVRMKTYTPADTSMIWDLAPVKFDTSAVSGKATLGSPSGYSSKNGPKYTIAGSGTMYFPLSMSNTTFNRYHISYYSSRPVSGTITYRYGSSTVTETIYLEPSDANTISNFTGLINSYLDGGKGSAVTQISIHAKTGNATDFVLYGVTVENYTVYASTVYVENSKYKIGALLTMGGGLSYLEDKTDGLSNVTNLLNRADTGRLVQQSFYAGNAYANDGYQPGYYNGQLWGYNPVQGGSSSAAGSKKSKIVDVIVSDNSIYVKCMPRDWATGNFAYSYMENIYTLTNDGVQIDNRFFDWSGYTFNAVDQELPAFYTISYLGNFVWYGGTSPWTYGSYTKETSLPFWGQVSGGVEVNAGVCRHYPYAAAETWCAWVNSSNWGIGIYTPGVTQLFAGRYAYNGSTSSSSSATNYVAPLVTQALTPYGEFTYSSMITTGHINTIRNTFYDHQTLTQQDFANTSIASAASMKVGEFLSLSAGVEPEMSSDKTITWTSSNSSVATVCGGLVEAVGEGSAVITATTANGQTTQCTITVAGTVTMEYTVTLTDTKNETTTQTVIAGTQIVLPAPHCAGFTFNGWYCMQDGKTYPAGSRYTVQNDVHFVSTWEAIVTRMLTYHANGGSGAPSAQSAYNGESVIISDVVPTREGATFLGWAETMDATTPVYQPGQSIVLNRNLTLFAVWELTSQQPGTPEHPIQTELTVMRRLLLQNRIDFQFGVPKDQFHAEITDITCTVVREKNGALQEALSLQPDAELSSDTMLIFAYRGIAAAEMTDEMQLTFSYLSNGTYYKSQTITTSIASYINDVLIQSGNEKSQQNTMLVDLLCYGAAAQTYFSYHTDALATDILSPEQLALGSSQTPNVENITTDVGEGLTLVNRLRLDNHVQLSYGIAAQSLSVSDPSTLSLHLMRADTGEVVILTNPTLESGYYIFDYTGLSTPELGVKLTAQVYADGIPVSAVRITSVHSYLAHANTGSETDALFSSLLRFSHAAAQFYGV